MQFYRLLASVIEDSLLVFWFGLILSTALYLLKKQRAFQVLTALTVAWLFVITVSPLPQYLIANLEDDFPVIDSHRTGEMDSVDILVLGGGHSIAPSIPASGQLSTSALARLVEAVRLSRIFHHSVIITSGYSASGRVTHAQMLQAAALELGVSADRLKVSDKPQNTKQEVDEYVRTYKNRKHKLVVVTSAFHMRRAILYFNKAGMSPMPAPTAFFIKHDPLKSSMNFIPSAEKIQMMNFALHEYLGILEAELFY